MAWLTRISFHRHTLKEYSLAITLVAGMALSIVLYYTVPQLFFLMLFCGVLFAREWYGSVTGMGSLISFTDIAAIFLSYVYSPLLGVIAVLWGLGAKALFGRMGHEHLAKALIMCVSCFVIAFLRPLSLTLVAVLAMLMRYAAEYLVDSITGSLHVDFMRIPRTILTVLVVHLSAPLFLSLMLQ